MKKIVKNRVEKGQNIGQILGINVISTSNDQLLARVRHHLTHNVHFYIVTPNPELVLMAQENKLLKEALNSSEFPVPDGIGIKFASMFLFGKTLDILPGRELFNDLIKLADRNKWKVFFLGGENGEAEVAAGVLGARYKSIKILADSGPRLDKNAEPVTDFDKKSQKDAFDKINKFIPDLLFVAFGNPKQEIWIHKNIGKLRVGGAMCVGGTFRYVAGLSKLPPKWMEKLGLEWLWRVITEPKRIGRIWNAVIVFPWKVLVSNFR
jgi:N-acetylglucosaminyldiphosphoundecaprenol N-acetyl-beta-D-mannosaminyltransferase